MDDCDVLFLVGTDFPYRDWYPDREDRRPARRRGRRTSAGVPRSTPRPRRRRRRHPARPAAAARRRGRTAGTSTRATEKYAAWHDRQQALLDPGHDTTLVGRVRAVFDNPDDRIRPEAVAAARRPARRRRTPIFTTDTGMSTVWLSRFVDDERPAPAARLLQPRLDGQRHAAGPRRPGARPRPPGRSPSRRRRSDDAARRPAHGGHATSCRSASSSSTTAGSAWSSSSRSRAASRSSAPSSTTPTSPPSRWPSASTPAG